MAFNFPRSAEYAQSLVEAPHSLSPAAKCAVINCKNTISDNNPDVRFYTFPDDHKERTIWVALLARVDRSRHPWQIQQAKTHYVCSKHFLGDRRLLLPETDHYFPSIFPAILNENCLPNVGSLDEKFALIPRAAGFYKHRVVVREDGTTRVTAHREELPELDADGLKWSELQGIAYNDIYLPFTAEFNRMISQIRQQDKKAAPKVAEITSRMNYMKTQMKLGMKRMLEAEEHHSAASEVNIYNTDDHHAEQDQPASHNRSRPMEKSRERTKTHSFVTGQNGSKIPIDVTMPSIMRNWSYTEIRWPRIGEKVFALDNFGNWPVSIVVEVNCPASTLKVKIQGSARESVVPLGNVAYACPQTTQVQLGCRVLAGNTSPLPGVVMEYPKWQNNNRYLILFENGRWAYHDHRSIFLICKQTSQTHLHVNREIQQIVREFFLTTEHPLLRVAVGQRISAARENQWFDSEVVSLDGNLIEVAFLLYGSKLATEWLYAGSDRLQEIFNLKHPSASTIRKHAKRKIACKANQPYVEYTDDAMDVITLSDDDDDDHDEAQNQKKNTARKSTASQQLRKRTQSSIVERDPGFLGQVIKEVVKPLAKSRDFVHHTCGPTCLPINDDPLEHTGYSPYLMPHLMAWKRILLESVEGKTVMYKAPCGKSLRNDTEVANYLLQTESKIRIDQFCFDPDFDEFAVWEPEIKNVFMADVTNKEEPYPISFVNGVDFNRDELAPYWAKIRPTKAAKRSMFLDEEFLPCCTCDDGCLDRSKCQCQLQTVAVSDSISGSINPKAGYTFRSLPELLVTGIYECNARCSCTSQCINKVAQNGVQVRMQIFKTQKKGLGVRTVHDIPRGRFLCTYAGTLLTDREAESSGQDTYFAELDFMDVVCRSKEGYESSVSDIEDDLYFPDDSDDESSAPKSLKPDALRKLYFGKEESYVMDALEGGNIGRYFNHSCDPNIFVQNVFVDTHDLRLPWLGFFTDRLIKAGEELTWDYSYVVGSVKGKKLLCYCNAANCRKRLL